MVSKLYRWTQPCQDDDHASKACLEGKRPSSLQITSLRSYAAAPSPARITTMPRKLVLKERNPIHFIVAFDLDR
jgi:hypothetical protein